jgi:hypothetical protein
LLSLSAVSLPCRRSRVRVPSSASKTAVSWRFFFWWAWTKTSSLPVSPQRAVALLKASSESKPGATTMSPAREMPEGFQSSDSHRRTPRLPKRETDVVYDAPLRVVLAGRRADTRGRQLRRLRGGQLPGDRERRRRRRDPDPEHQGRAPGEPGGGSVRCVWMSFFNALLTHAIATELCEVGSRIRDWIAQDRQWRDRRTLPPLPIPAHDSARHGRRAGVGTAGVGEHVE